MLLPTLEMQMLGEFRLTFDDKCVTAVNSPRLQSLLAFLVLHRDAPQSRQHLAFMLWPDSSETQARAILRNLIYALRQALPYPDRYVSSDALTLQWRSDSPFTLDVVQFEYAAARAASIRDWQTVVELYHGDLLPGGYDDWILSERDRLRQKFLEALDQLAGLLEAGGDYGAAIRYTQRLLQVEPVREETYRRLMHLYAQSGDRAGVVRVYNTCATILQRELCVEPSPETSQAYNQFLKTCTLGSTQTEIPPAAAESRRNNLPLQLTSFIGREREKEQIKELVAQHPLLSLTGAGGVGKTRLALAVAADLLDAFPDGVWWVDLAPLGDATLLPQEVALAMGLRESPGQPLLATLMSRIANKHMLLILDNCEHMVLSVGRLAESLLQSSSDLRILATSRESLRITGEITWRVPPLSIPADTRLEPTGETGLKQTDALCRYESIRLFVDRGTHALPTFAITPENSSAVMQICRRLDGIPLAIELAAARVKLLSVEQIADRLDDCFRLLAGGSRTALPHHQTLRSTMEWSYHLLSEKEQLLLRRLSVFAGGFSLEATEEVCADDALAKSEILDLVSSLQDKSLVEVEQQGHQARNYMLETVRHYAADKSTEMKEDAEPLHARHLEFFMKMTEGAEQKLQTAEQPIWLHRLEIELDNLRGALKWSLNGSHAPSEDIIEKGVRLAAALWQFWLVRGHLKEGRHWLALAIEKSSGNKLAKSSARAKALVMAVGLADFHGDLSARIPWCEEALAIVRDLGERPLMAAALMFLGDYQARYAQTWPRTLARLTEALSLARKLEAKWLTALTLELLGMGARSQGDVGRTRLYLEESLAMSREVGDPWLISGILDNLGSQEAVEGHYDQAALLYDEGLRLRRELKDPPGVAGILNDIGQMARYRQDYVRAAQMFEESLALFKEYGQKESSAIVLRNLGYVTLQRDDPVRATALFQESLLISKELENREQIAYALGGLAVAAWANGQAEHAVKLFGAVDAMLRSTGAAIPPADETEYNRMLAAAETKMPKPSFAAAWAEGESLGLEQAIAFGIKVPE